MLARIKQKMDAAISVVDSPRVTTAFKVVYLLLVFLSFNSITANQPYLSLASYGVVIFGALILLARLLNYKKYLKMPFLVLLALFIVSMAVSCALTAQYGYIENVQGIAWATLQFFLLYMVDLKISVSDYKKEFKIIAIVFLSYTSIATLCGLILGVIGYTSDSLSMYWYGSNAVGLFANRLYGLYSDPNYGAVFCVIAIVLTLYIMRSRKRPVILVFGSINVLIQLSYVVLSGSRTGLVTGIVVISCYAVMTFWRSRVSINKSRVGKVLSSTLITTMVVCGLFLADVGITKLFSTVEPLFQGVLVQESPESNEIREVVERWAAEGDQDSQNVVAEAGGTIESSQKGVGVTEREDILDNMTTNRIDIWKSGLEIFIAHPLVGVSHRNLLAVAEAELPETYIVQAWYATLHNTFVDVLASQGLIGIIVFVSFLLGVMVYIFRRFRYLDSSQYRYACILFCSLLAPAVSMLFYTEILYINTVGSVVFWIFLGYLVHLVYSVKDISTNCLTEGKTDN